MKILIEGYQYQEQQVAHILKGFEPFSKEGKISIEHVGYFYSKEIADCIFFLPKVLMNENGNVLWRENLKPEDILDLGIARDKGLIDEKDYKFLSNFAVWIYRSVKEYYRLNPDSTIILNKSFSLLDKSSNKKDATLLDIILSLIKFNNENQDFFMFTVKNIHSGYNKINWTKTISKSQAIVQRNSPVYLNPVNKKKQINFDEELFIIFFSILNYVKEEFNFPTSINFNYKLITGEAFKNYCNGFGEIRLRQIKYKYFSDKALQLWNLCYHFFDSNKQVNSSSLDCDYLLAKNFNIVFEAIIDELVGDNKKKIPQELHDQPDGKIVDHIFKYESLTNEDNIYYIGDSKYYKIGGSLGGNSVYKQYTYAKNVIQFNINWFYEKKEHVKYRDEITEGYNITPNFFISAEIPNDLSYQHDQLTPRSNEKDQRQIFQFKNRLFDRDTLWLSHYDVNFLYVIALYARANDYEKRTFKDNAQNQFKQHILDLLNNQYDFCVLEPTEQFSLQRAVDINFKRLYGKVFAPFEDKNCLILSLEKNAVENNVLLQEIRPYFYILENYKLGENVSNLLLNKQTARKDYSKFLEMQNFYDSLAAEEEGVYNTTTIERIFNDSTVSRNSYKSELKLSETEVKDILPIEDSLVLVGYYNGEKHLADILKSCLYYVRTGFRPGSIQLVAGYDSCQYLFLHHKQEKHLLRLKGTAPRLFTGNQLARKGFTNNHPEEEYLGFELAESKPLPITDEKLSEAIIHGIGNRKADSYFTTLKELFGV